MHMVQTNREEDVFTDMLTKGGGGGKDLPANIRPYAISIYASTRACADLQGVGFGVE